MKNPKVSMHQSYMICCYYRQPVNFRGNFLKLFYSYDSVFRSIGAHKNTHTYARPLLFANGHTIEIH